MKRYTPMLKSNMVERIEMREVMNDGEWVKWEDVKTVLPTYRGTSFFDLVDEIKEANAKNVELNKVISDLQGSVTRKLIRIDEMQAELTTRSDQVLLLHTKLHQINMTTAGY
jgi:hypothetical protein